MGQEIGTQDWKHMAFYAFFGLISVALIIYYFSDTILHFTTPQQFPINSFERFPLTWLIFPAEVFSAAFALYFVYCLFTDRLSPRSTQPLDPSLRGPVAILLPVYNEPADIVANTIKACKRVRWKEGTRIYLLDDSTDQSSKADMARLAKRHKCRLVRRADRRGFKAGNINNAIQKEVKEPYFIIFDADQAPLPEFLERTMDWFADEQVAFVQTPQHFVNEDSYLERAAKLGANLFFQSQCRAKARDGALPFCGTNAIIRADVFKKVGGLAYYTSTEDIDLGLRFNELGYRGAYVPEILAHGYAPHDFSSYAIQQYRWANGNLAILRQNWLKILGGNTSLRHKMHTLFTLGWWFIGLVTLIYVLVPLSALVLQSGTHHTWLPSFMFVLIYFNVVMGIGMIYVALQSRTTEKVRWGDALLQYSLITNSALLYARAAVMAMLKRYAGFKRTSKTRSATGWRHVQWNVLLGLACFLGSVYALYRSVLAVTVEEVRTFVPISLWLLFYAIVLLTSLLFVGGNTPRGASE